MNNKLPKTLPDCALLRILAAKASHRHDTDFNFLGRLDDFRQRISAEVRQINELFPEYTPHDEQYHLKQLFRVADTILGRERLEEMHSAELFVLAVALYGHDWGMAVSNSEKQYILTGQPPEGTPLGSLWILPNERDRLAQFVRNQRLALDTAGCLQEVSVEMWREYVRQTHAFRSGERVRRYFEPIDGGVADAASRVCEGHWLDFEDLRDPDSYPVNFSVLGETANLRALAVYLRLIDLLDLAEDRTPYVIWKFVAPRDPRSKMEWAKHRALRPVTCPSYQGGRVVLVDGSTDNHEVYAALEDLRIWCEQQLRGCNDLLARMNDPRHKLDLYHIDWRVSARGFKPVLMQFEFDREQMFEILGDEIYQGDSYVFLRELLQNSIDAIRMRREILQRKGIDPGNLGMIHVTVEHGDSGDAIVTWQDDGIGMDEYIVRHYFAVAGKSYYRSEDFEREGLKLDPISRFGIGTLSCFMVADHVEIETYKDPYLHPQGEPLKITIPAMRRQFRIETFPCEVAKVGTTVRVYVEGGKLPIDDGDKTVKPLDVTAYLSVVAGFVEFPIVITEGDRKTVVLHPKQDAEAARRRFGQEFQVHQLDLTYPWTEVILPQDLPIAHEALREEHYDLSSDSNLEGYDGAVTYLAPAGSEIDLRRASSDGPQEGAEVIIRSQAENARRQVRWSMNWSGYRTGGKVGIARSASHAPACAVYRDGILLAAAAPPHRPAVPRSPAPPLPSPRLVVNLSKSKAPRVDLARTELLGQSEHWSLPINQARLHHLYERSLRDLLALDPVERLYQLGRSVAFHFVGPRELWQMFPHERWPLPFLEAGGRLTVLEWQEVADAPVYLCPEDLSGELMRMIRCRWITQEEYTGPLVQWIGGQCLISWQEYEPISFAVDRAIDLWQFPIRESHYSAGARFLSTGSEGDPPLLQEIWLPMEVPEGSPDIEEVLETIVEDPSVLNSVEVVLALQGKPTLTSYLSRAIPFHQPFEGCFAYGLRSLNMKHPITQALFRFSAALELSKRRRDLPQDQIGLLQDGFTGLFHSHIRYYEELCERFRRFCSLVCEIQPFDIEFRDLVPAREEFVPGTLASDGYFSETTSRRFISSTEPFGEPLT